MEHQFPRKPGFCHLALEAPDGREYVVYCMYYPKEMECPATRDGTVRYRTCSKDAEHPVLWLSTESVRNNAAALVTYKLEA